MLLLYSHHSAATLPRLHCRDQVIVRRAGSSRQLNSTESGITQIGRNESLN